MPEDNSYFSHNRSELIDLIPSDIKRILDCGCGSGEFSALIKKKHNAICVGIDSSRRACTLARKNLDYIIHTDLNTFDFTTLQTDFDLIIFNDILEHLLCPPCVLKKSLSKLSNHGYILSSIPNISHPEVIKQLQQGLFRYTHAGILDATHLKFYTQTTIFQMFTKLGLKIIEFRPYPSFQNPIQYHILATRLIPFYPEPKITIIIPTLNCLNYTKQCIDSITANTKIPHIIIVIDNHSTDGTIKYLREQKYLYHIENSFNLGFSIANNIGLECVKTEYFFLSNNDIVYPPHAIDRLAYAITLDPKLAILGPTSNYVSGPQKTENIHYNNTEELYTIAKQLHSQTDLHLQDCPRIVFFSTLFRTKLLQDIGYLDENFTIGNFEDDDYCLRSLQSGWKNAFCETVYVHHYGSTTWKNNNIDYSKIYEINRNYFLKKHNILTT